MKVVNKPVRCQVILVDTSHKRGVPLSALSALEALEVRILGQARITRVPVNLEMYLGIGEMYKEMQSGV